MLRLLARLCRQQYRARVPTQPQSGVTATPDEGFDNFIRPAIHRSSFDKLRGAIDEAGADPEPELPAGST